MTTTATTTIDDDDDSTTMRTTTQPRRPRSPARPRSVGVGAGRRHDRPVRRSHDGRIVDVAGLTL